MSNDPMCKTDEVKSIGRNLALNGEKDYTPEEIALLWTIDPNGVKYYKDRYRGQEFKRKAYHEITHAEPSDDAANFFFEIYSDKEAWRTNIVRSFEQLVYGKFNRQENNTTLGTIAEIGAGFTGVDIAQDSRDLVYDIKSRLDDDKENDVSTGEIIFDAICVLPVIGVIKHHDEIIAIFRRTDKIIAIKRLAKLDDLKNMSRLTGAADVVRSAKKKLKTVDAGFYNRVMNACEQSDTYLKKFSAKGIYDNAVIDQILKYENELTNLAEKNPKAFDEVVSEIAEKT